MPLTGCRNRVCTFLLCYIIFRNFRNLLALKDCNFHKIIGTSQWWLVFLAWAPWSFLVLSVVSRWWCKLEWVSSCSTVYMSLIAFGLWAAKLLRASHAKCLAALLLQKKKKNSSTWVSSRLCCVFLRTALRWSMNDYQLARFTVTLIWCHCASDE